jgi:serine/threonine-protein kinase RsbW
MSGQFRDRSQELRPSLGGKDGCACEVLHRSSEIVSVLDRVVARLQEAGFSDRELFDIRLALDEALVNAIKHGHRYDTKKSVRLRYRLTPAALVVEIQDEGRGFRPEDVPDPLAPENRERPGGRGLLLMRRFMTSVRYNEMGTCVTLCKQRSARAC